MERSAEQTEVSTFELAGISIQSVGIKMVRGRHIECHFRVPYDDDTFVFLGRLAGLEENSPGIEAEVTVTQHITTDEREEQGQLPLAPAEDGAEVVEGEEDEVLEEAL